MYEVFWLSLFLPLLLKCLVDTILIMSSSMALEPSPPPSPSPLLNQAVQMVDLNVLHACTHTYFASTTHPDTGCD